MRNAHAHAFSMICGTRRRLSCTVIAGIAAVVMSLAGCEKMPTAVDRTGTLSITLSDISPFMTSLYGTSAVRNAEVTFRSINYGREYAAVSDSLGRVTVSGLPSDIYSVAAVRYLTPGEVQRVLSVSVQRKLTGGLNAMVFRVDDPDTRVTIQMELAPLSSIVMSELYTCGAPGAGLYWQDKYIEICNISETVQYLDGIMVADVYKGFLTDPYIRTKQVWKFPGSGTQYPIRPHEFMLISTDAIDHRISAPQSVDLRNSTFEFYLTTAADIDNPLVPNMLLIHQTSGNDWLMGGELGAYVLSKPMNDSAFVYENELLLIPKENVLDGVEYLKDPTRLDLKKLDVKIDGGAAGGITFYTGYSMERRLMRQGGSWTLMDNNNSSIDFEKITHPTPGYHYALP